MDPQLILALVLGSLVGFSLGLLGGGGSILAVPVLVYVAGVEPKQAIPMSLMIVGATALYNGSLYLRSKLADLQVAITFGIPGIFGAKAGKLLYDKVPPLVLLVIFGGLMLIVGGAMFAKSMGKGGASEPEGEKNLPLMLVTGLCLGVLTGFLGVGGGFLFVPALMVFAKLPMRKAIGTSLLVIFMNSFSTIAFFLWDDKGFSFPIGLALGFMAVAMVGGLIGKNLAMKVSVQGLKRGFAIFILVIGTLMVWKNLGDIRAKEKANAPVKSETAGLVVQPEFIFR